MFSAWWYGISERCDAFRGFDVFKWAMDLYDRFSPNEYLPVVAYSGAEEGIASSLLQLELFAECFGAEWEIPHGDVGLTGIWYQTAHPLLAPCSIPRDTEGAPREVRNKLL